MSFIPRSSVKVLLFNQKREILLMCADDPKTTSADGESHGRFWFPIGGGIEEGETVEQAAIREVYEETGIKENEIELGPIVWHGDFDLILAGIPTRINEKFIVAKTNKEKVSLENLTEWEKNVVKNIEWFSLDDIKNCEDVIFPVVLVEYLPDIIAENYPEKSIEIDLGKKPDKK